ncbi:MAG TPA: NTP transferase domain-containing protein, partial [Longimicrobiales bacterium]|nr:NTP transferase domain-containing protein [Longimicrobiales bacterium]
MSALLGVILAGGEGRRMGGPKDGVPVPGGTLLSRAWNALAPVGSPVILQGGASAPPGMDAAPDLRSGEGPLAGLEAALVRAREAGSPGVAVLAVDLPRVTAPVVLELARRWRDLPAPDTSAVVADTRRGMQPLAGIYGAGLAPELARWLDTGSQRAARAWADSLGDRILAVPEADLTEVAGHPEPFLNVNRPGHVERAMDLAPPAPPMVSVTGWKDSGKTTVAVGLAAELRGRG